MRRQRSFPPSPRNGEVRPSAVVRFRSQERRPMPPKPSFTAASRIDRTFRAGSLRQMCSTAKLLCPMNAGVTLIPYQGGDLSRLYL
jgi:hypothetical protein